MSEYKISSSYFSRRNKTLLLICVFFFSCSTHIFKNVFPFLFMLTGGTNRGTSDTIKKEDGSNFEILRNYGNSYEMQEERGGNASEPHEDDVLRNERDTLQKGNFIEMVSEQGEKDNENHLGVKQNHGGGGGQAKGKMNNHSIYLYSNMLSLIYMSSLLTYIFILFFDLSKKNYIMNSFYIVNLISHCIIFFILSEIQMYNTNLSYDPYRQKRDKVHTVSIAHTGNITFEKITPEMKREELNFVFKNYIERRLNVKSIFFFDNCMDISNNNFLTMQFHGTPFHRRELEDVLRLFWRREDRESRRGGNSRDGRRTRDSNESLFEDSEMYKRGYFTMLYAFIVISSICSGYIKIYQKKVLYCIFYVNIGVITSLLILMNSLFKLMAHSLNYVVSNDKYITNISDYIIMFLFIDIFGLLMIFIFSYKWFYQKNLWTNLHTIFYNYKYICFYLNRTYYLYTEDKNIDNILVHIDLYEDKNVEISFCAYTNIEKSIFYDYFLRNTPRNNKLNIIEIADRNFKVNCTYKANPCVDTRAVEHIQGVEDTRAVGNTRAIEDTQTGDNANVMETPTAKQPFSRKQNHSYTMKPYKICIETVQNLSALVQDELEGLTDRPNGVHAGGVHTGGVHMGGEDTKDKKIIGRMIHNYELDDDPVPPKDFDRTDADADAADTYITIGDDAGSHIDVEGWHFAKGEKKNLQNRESVHFENTCEDVNGKRRDYVPSFYQTGEPFHKRSSLSSSMRCSKDMEKEDMHVDSKHIYYKDNYYDMNFMQNKNLEMGSELHEQNNTERYAEDDHYINREEPIFFESIQHDGINEKKEKYLIPKYDEENRCISYDDLELSYDNDCDGDGGAGCDGDGGAGCDGDGGAGCDGDGGADWDGDNSPLFLKKFKEKNKNKNCVLRNKNCINIGIYILLHVQPKSVNRMYSEVLAIVFFNLIGISESIIPTVIISQIPTHLCVKNNESITSAFAVFELVSMVIISLNNYVFGCFLIKEEYLKGLYVLFVFVILVIALILLLILTIYLKKKRHIHVTQGANNMDLTQPLL
ncbi:conserved Plasmodium protein, unknown function [Plasmodium ovale wallikeri]|uniref:Transporter n=1 Tax=Plasmodium ovale wallikeri TaxID=864142 RepID=A0A1A8YTZ8_PLAOA|nr:conserved Plasmodium protein, unknown function [Plasmodium ovale wallikeri]SBT35553.1 conserved Plasmodium protein, unknown function [Plasmodium ovale wallikeri]